jgi:hypothetical protein
MQYLTTANILGWLFFIIALQMTFIAHWLATVALSPGRVETAAEQYARPIRAILIGLLPLAILLGVGIGILSKAPPAVKWVGGLIIAIPIVLGLAGASGLAQRIGAGLPSPLDEHQPWRRTLRGGTVMALAMLLPVIGQIFFIPLVLASGLGVWTLGLFAARCTAAVETPAITPELRARVLAALATESTDPGLPINS